MNYYDVLGVSKNASDEQIKKTYREQIRFFNSDVFDGCEDVSWRKTTQLNEAFETLTDPKKRSKYNAELKAEKQRAEELELLQNPKQAKKKKVVRIVAAAAVLAVVGFGLYFGAITIQSRSFDNGYSSGYLSGETAGIDSGYSIGYDAGYSDGYDGGYEEGGKAVYVDAYMSGYEEGKKVKSSQTKTGSTSGSGFLAELERAAEELKKRMQGS